MQQKEKTIKIDENDKTLIPQLFFARSPLVLRLFFAFKAKNNRRTSGEQP
jgi:hypothetical protein